MYGFAKRIEELERQIHVLESKGRTEDKWKKSLENWLLRNFDFDIQEDLTKFSDPDDDNDLLINDGRRSEELQLSGGSYEEPSVSNYAHNFPLGPKQVYNNPHLIIQSQSYNNNNSGSSSNNNNHPNSSSSGNILLDQVNGLHFSKNILNNSNSTNTSTHYNNNNSKSQNHRIIDNETISQHLQLQQQPLLLLKPAHLNSQKTITSLQQLSSCSSTTTNTSSSSSLSHYDNNNSNTNNNSKSSSGSKNNSNNKLERSEQRRKSVNLLSELRKSATTTPISLQKIDSSSSSSSTSTLPSVLSSNKNSHLSSSSNHPNIVGSNITLTPLSLTSSSSPSLLNNSITQIIEHSLNDSELNIKPLSSSNITNPSIAHYNLSNTCNLINNIRHNVTSLLNISSSQQQQQLKREPQELEANDEEEDEDGEQEVGEEDDFNNVPYIQTSQLQIQKRNVNNHEESSDGRNSSVGDLDMSCEDMEEIADSEDTQNQTRLNSGKSSTGDVYKGNFFSNHPKTPLPQVARKETICNFCCKSYSSQTYLKTHIDVVHKGMKAFRCKLCGVSFGFKSDLTRHLRSHLKSQRKTNVV